MNQRLAASPAKASGHAQFSGAHRGKLTPVFAAPVTAASNFAAPDIKWSQSMGKQVRKDISQTLVNLAQAIEISTGVQINCFAVIDLDTYGKKVENARYVSQMTHPAVVCRFRVRTRGSAGAVVAVTMQRELTRKEIETLLDYYQNPPKLAAKLVKELAVRGLPASTVAPSPAPTEKPIVLSVAPTLAAALDSTTPEVYMAPQSHCNDANLTGGTEALAMPHLAAPTPAPSAQPATAASAEATPDRNASQDAANAPVMTETEDERRESDLRGFYSLLLEQHPDRPAQLSRNVISKLANDLFPHLQEGRGKMGNFFSYGVHPFAKKVQKDQSTWSFDWKLVDDFIQGAPCPKMSIKDKRAVIKFHDDSPTGVGSSANALQSLAQRVQFAQRRPVIETEIAELNQRDTELNELIARLTAEKTQNGDRRSTLEAQLAAATFTPEEQQSLDLIMNLMSQAPTGA